MTEKTISVSDQINPSDFRQVAEAIANEFEARKERRKDIEKQWAEIDRQLRMEPELSHKKLQSGKIDENRAWMPETELPLQAQTLEMLVSDNRRLKFPRNRDFFTARAALTEKYAKAYENAGNPVPGEKGENLTVLNQDNGDRIAQAVVSHFHSQYDFRSHVDLIDSQAYTYGFGAGRVRRVKTRILGHDMRGKASELTIPILVPRESKKVYLDDSQHAVMHEGHVVGPNIIQWRTMKLADLRAAAQKDDSYIRSEIDRLEDDEGNVMLIELEGDLVHETSQSTIVERDVEVTVGMGKKGNNSHIGLVRFKKTEGFSSYIIHKYHLETPTAYGTSPLMKGMPVARAAAQQMNRIIESGQLKITPPVGYSKDEPAWAASGGPVIHPGALWPTLDELKPYVELGGDSATLFATFTGLIQLYTDVTGVNPPRLGAQTKSHTTAFAKDVELSQGSVRTVDYVNSSLEGPMTRLLELEYRMGIKDWRKQLVYVEPWNEFAELSRGHLPDTVKFIAIGAAAPAEDQARTQQKLTSAQLAIQLDSISQEAGNDATLDIPALIKKTLSDGGWQDVSEITTENPPAEPNDRQLTGTESAVPLSLA